MEQTSTPSIIEQTKLYLETKIKLLKYEGINKASGIIAKVATDLIMVVLTLLAFLFLSITLALFAGHLLGTAWGGFGCITLLYLLLPMLTRMLKINLQNVFIRISIRKVFKSKQGFNQ